MDLLEDEGKEKAEYSLAEHLANNLIDMYINLPSKNNYRRPASYTSKGYRTRRMAVDYAVPLLNNIKCAKLLAEALIRKSSVEVSSVDYQTSHATHTFPGLVNISAFVPDLLSTTNKDFEDATKSSLGGGFTTALIIPYGVSSQITDVKSLDAAQSGSAGSAHSNYALSIVASTSNVQALDDEILAASKSLFIPFADTFTVQPMSQKVAVVAAHFATWPSDKPIVTDAKGSDLASVLLLASLHNRTVHVTDVRSKEDLLLISLSKAKQLKVTCDIAVYSLFYSREDFNGVKCLPSKEDQERFWKHLDVVDAFSVGTVPYELATELKMTPTASVGTEDTLPLLLTAVSDGRLTLKAIQERLHDNPIRIFELPDQSHTQVEVVVNRRSIIASRKFASWSPLDKSKISGAVNRVIVHGQTVFLDGSLLSAPLGRNISGAVINHPQIVDRRSSISGGRPVLSSEHISSPSVPLLRPADGVLPAHVGPMSLTSSVASPNALAIASTPRVFSPLTPHPSFHRKNILSVKQFTHSDIHDLFSLAHEMRLQVERNGTLDILKGKVLCTLFYEPSTRTSASFDAAMKRCGGEVVTVNADRSSVQKGETLEDTVRTLSCYGDAIVLRHPDVGSAQIAAKFSPIPIINAGDGIGEHPTQVCFYHVLLFGFQSDLFLKALLDVYTIRSELGTVNGRTITLIGDLKNGRTVHSLVTLLSLYSVRLNFVAPASLAMPQSVINAARKAGIFVRVCDSLEEVLSETDVLYVTRVQKERFESEEDWVRVKDAYRIDHSILSRAKEDMIVMHPLPRVNGAFVHCTTLRFPVSH